MLNRLDLTLLISTLLLVFIGFAAIYSAEYVFSPEERASQSSIQSMINPNSPVATSQPKGGGRFVKQLLWFLLGCIGFAFFYFLPYHKISKRWLVIFLFSICFLVLPILIGRASRSSNAWLNIGPFGIQPSELVKLLFIISFAYYLTYFGRSITTLWGFITTIWMPILLTGVILMQKEFGTAIMYMPIYFAMCYIAGARAIHIFSLITVVVISLMILVFLNYGLTLDKRTIETVNDIAKLQSAQAFNYNDLLTEKDNNNIQEKIRNNLKLANGEDESKPLTTAQIKNLKDDYEKTVQEFLLLALLKIGFVLLIIFGLIYLLGYQLKSRWIKNISFFILVVALGIIVAGPLQYVAQEHHSNRIIVLFDPDFDPNLNYQPKQSEITIGSGGPFGRNYLRGPLTHLKYNSDNSTDFIFSVVGEEFGFFGSIVVLFLFGLLIYRGYYTLTNAKDSLGVYIAAGVTAMIAFHVFVNIGMATRIVPTIGIPLPFLSYGGSSLITNLSAIGVLLGIQSKRYGSG